MQILCTHCKSIFQSHIFNLAYFIKFFISSNYIPFVQIISPQKFSSHIFSLSLSQFYLQIQSNTSPPTFFCPLCFSIPSQNVQSSILRVLNLLCFDVRKLLSHPSPLTHFSIVFFSFSPPPPLPPPIITYRALFSTLFFHPFVQSLLHPPPARPICPVPRSTPVNPPCPRGSEAEWKLNAQSAVTTIDLYSPIYRRCEEVC